MAKAGKRKNAQFKVLDEIKSQLVMQAERWGRKDYYTPLKLEEMVLGQCRKIYGDFLSEKSNLEYELHLIEADRKEIKMKLDKLEGYMKKANRVIKQREKNIDKQFEKLIGNIDDIDAFYLIQNIQIISDYIQFYR